MQFTIKWKRKPKKELTHSGYPLLPELMKPKPGQHIEDEVMTASGWQSYRVHSNAVMHLGINRSYVRYGSYETEQDTMKKSLPQSQAAFFDKDLISDLKKAPNE
jgi:hypothetical protein